ncbi:MAG: hypothetical protein EZS28_032885 [Streblomastix strix]|uniref:Uncharacterized protein n=1 Tax=Streblomastix strix TaxID=222440 RepID=A0A5J4UM58_9EUKA|nr:MAG: hypothetical protein EZS28_032885 [Streblomastix strix]
MDADKPDIKGTVRQLTCLQPSYDIQSPSLKAGQRLKQTRSISTWNSQRTDPQINKGQEDNAEVEKDEQPDETRLIKNKDNRINIISQPPVQENLGIQSQNNHCLNALSQMEKDTSGPSSVGVQEKPKAALPKLKRNQLPKFQKPRLRLKRPQKNRIGTLQPSEVSVEISPWNREEERADVDGSSSDEGKEWRIDIQRKDKAMEKQSQIVHTYTNTENVGDGTENERHGSKPSTRLCGHLPSGPVADVGRDLLMKYIKLRILRQRSQLINQRPNIQHSQKRLFCLALLQDWLDTK